MNLEELQIRNAFLEKENSALKRAIRELVSESKSEQTTLNKTDGLEFPDLLKKINEKIKNGFSYSEQELDFIRNANKGGFEPTKNQYNWLLKISNKKSEIKKPAFPKEMSEKSKSQNNISDVSLDDFDDDIPF